MSVAAPVIAPPVIDWFAVHGRDLPWRGTGFTAWGSLVAEFMLQQTPVARVVPRLEVWLARWPAPADLAAEPPGEAVRAWGTLGYPRRALNLHRAAVAITERHNGVVPREVEELLTLPGVGAYTARAVAVFAYGQRHPVVDINIRRVIARAVHGNGEPGPASNTRDLADMSALLPESPADAALANVGIMELGALVCVARTPRCAECPISDLCRWRALGYPDFTGTPAARSKKFEGSDRQVRGLVLAELRASEIPVSRGELALVWADAVQLDRSIAGLLADGLAVSVPASDGIASDGTEGFELPS